MMIQEKDFQGFVKGKEKSFEVIFCQYYKTLVSFAMRFGVEQMEAEDVVIEVIHHIWEIRREVKSPAALHSLFFTAVRNRTLNVNRNLKNREKILYDHPAMEEDEGADFLMEEEITRLLDEAVTALPPQCRQVVLLLMTGKSIAEIAGEMDISVNTVKTYKLRAIELLKVALHDYPLILCLILFRICS